MTIQIDAFRPNADYVLIRKCVNDHVRGEDGAVLLYLTDHTVDDTNWVEILAVGPKCKQLSSEQVGGMVQCPDWSHDLVRVPSTDRQEEVFLVRERLIIEQGVLVMEELDEK